MQEPTLSYLSNEDRLKAFNAITNGCAHIWSKGQMQKDRLSEVLSIFIQLAEHDPYFLAHFTSYAIKKLDSKDLKVVATFANSLSDADGTPFITGNDAQGRPIYSPTYKKPNLRMISQAAVQELDPKLVSRVIAIANIKQSLGTRRAATHFANSLKTAIRKWVRFREQNPKALEGIKKAAFAPTVKTIYRMMHMKPSQEAAEIFGWKQGSVKKGNVEKIEKRNLIDFTSLTDIQIAQKIRDDKLPVLGVMGALPGKISPVVAAAVLEQASGNQAVILRNLFDSQGLLKDKEVMKVFTEKIQTAKTALDRVEKLNTEVDIEVQKVLKTAKADKRKKDVGNIGRVYVHIDISGSMTGAIEFAKNNGAIIAECVHPDTRIFSNLSLKSMNEVQTTFSREGNLIPIAEKFSRNYSGTMIKITPMMLDSLSVTPDHPIYVIPREEYRSKEVKRLRGTIEYPIKKCIDYSSLTPVWKKASEIKPYDLVLIPKIRIQEENINNITEKEAEFYGWYVSEGWLQFRDDYPDWGRCGIAKKASRKKTQIIRNLIQELGYDFSESENQFQINSRELTFKLKEFLGS